MEMLAVKLFNDAYRGRRVMVTGHSGFKGSWLCLWLKMLGARVSGIALDPPTIPNHWDLLELNISDMRIDVRDQSLVYEAIASEKPEIVFHLAAQPLVRRSYVDPAGTWETNVMGTVNVLEAVRRTRDVRAAVIVTTDKCYKNREWPWAYRERDRLGGHDPYSASKAGAELVVESYRKAFVDSAFGALIATARAGNVIGGGDWSEDRLIPDLVRSIGAGNVLSIRSPGATRPWQHVLDCLSGYLLLGARLLEGQSECADSWNFGPESDSNRTVLQLLHQLQYEWQEANWLVTSEPHPHEAGLLQLDISKAKTQLGWRPVWAFDETARRSAIWYREWMDGGRLLSADELQEYVADAIRCGLSWAEQ